MLDTRIRTIIDPWLETMAQELAARGATANGVTFAGLAIGVLSAVAIAFGIFWLGLILLLVSRLCDGLDGAVARAGRQTDFGGFIDIVADFAFYGMIPLAFIIADPSQNAIAGSVLLLAFYINGASFLAYSVMVEKRDLPPGARGKKSLFYSVGLTEATETIVLFVLMCLIPDWFPVLAFVFAAMVAWTTVSRVVMARRTFDD